MIDLSVIVVTWQTRELVLDCLRAAQEALSPEPGRRVFRSEVFVVDNGSTDATAAAVRAGFPAAELIALPENVGFARACNVALKKARGHIVLLLNSDALLTRSVVERCLEVLEGSPEAGVAGVQLLHPDGKLQNSIHAFPGLWTELLPTVLLELFWPQRFPSKRIRHREPIDVEAVLGAVLFVRRDALVSVGLLSEDYFFFLEETDWCWRMRGEDWRVLHVPDARVVHLSGASSKRVHPGAARIEYHRSLYRFLRERRGRMTLWISISVRVARALASLVLAAPLALFSPPARIRWRARSCVLWWHLRGCPRAAGLSEVTPLDERARTRNP